MKIEKIKEAMLAYKDFYGNDMPFTDDIAGAKTKEELAELFARYQRHLDDQLADAGNHLNDFKKQLGL